MLFVELKSYRTHMRVQIVKERPIIGEERIEKTYSIRH